MARVAPVRYVDRLSSQQPHRHRSRLRAALDTLVMELTRTADQPIDRQAMLEAVRSERLPDRSSREFPTSRVTAIRPMSVLDRFLRYVPIDTRADEASTTVPSTPGQLVLLRLLARRAARARSRRRRARRTRLRHGHDPPPPWRAACPTIGFIAHVDTSPEMPGAGVKPIVHRALRRPRPRAAGRSDGGPAAGRHPGARRRRSATTSSPRRARRCSAPTTRPASPRSSTAAGVPVAHPEIPHGADPDRASRRTKRSAAAPNHFDVARFGAAVRLHDGRRQPRRARDRELLGRRDDRDASRLQHPSRLRQGPDGQRDQGWRRASSIGCRTTRLSPETTDGYDGFVHPYHDAGVASTGRRCGCWSATS